MGDIGVGELFFLSTFTSKGGIRPNNKDGLFIL